MPSTEYQELSGLLSFESGVGQSVALYALPAARICLSDLPSRFIHLHLSQVLVNMGRLVSRKINRMRACDLIDFFFGRCKDRPLSKMITIGITLLNRVNQSV